MNFQDTISEVDQSSYNELASVWESSVKATHHFLSEDDFEFYKSIIPQFFSQVKLHCVKGANNEILGFAGTGNNSLEMLFVKPDAIGKGIGKALILHAIQKLHVTRVDVNLDNKNAVRFYERSGFIIKARSEKDGFGKPYAILHLELNQHGK